MILRLLLLIFASVLLQAQSCAAQIVSSARVGINMREAPGTDQAILWKLDTGFPLQVLQRQGNWLKVRDFEESTGWVHQATIQQTPAVIVQANEGREQTVDVRQAASPDAAVVAQATYGTVFYVLGTQGDWVHVRHDQGVRGWILKDQLWGSTQ